MKLYCFVFCIVGLLLSQLTVSQSMFTTIDLGDVGYGNREFAGFEAFSPLLQNKEVVMLGEQTHGERTAYLTKFKLIKYLHEELGYNVLAFESSFYGCDIASQAIKNGESARNAMAKGVFSIWSLTEEFAALGSYLDSCNTQGDSLKIVGFDSNFVGIYPSENFMNDLKIFAEKRSEIDTSSSHWNQLITTVSLLLRKETKQIPKKQVKQDIDYLSLISQYAPTITYEERKWVQTLNNLKSILSDLVLGTNLRDEQMAQNLLWIKNEHPEEKIICWGATSHFIFNSREARFSNPLLATISGGYIKRNTMMGHFVKEALQDKLFVIGFTAGEGTYGTLQGHTLPPPKKGSLEFELMNNEAENIFIPFDDQYNHALRGRPLGHQYLRNDLSTLMDGIIFNQRMERPSIDKKFAATFYPDHPYFRTSAK